MASGTRRHTRSTINSTLQKTCERCSRLMSGLDRNTQCVACLGRDHGLNEGADLCTVCGATDLRYLRKRIKKFPADEEDSKPKPTKRKRKGSSAVGSDSD